MSDFRGISFPAHGAGEVLIGLATLVAPFALGFGTAGLLVGVLLGSLLVGNSLSTTAGRPSNVHAHRSWDGFAVAALLVAALLIGLMGDRTATACFTAAALALALLSLSTRYTLVR